MAEVAYTVIDYRVFSEAAESVAPVEMAPWVPIQESAGSKRGQTYMSASGDKLPNLGEKKLEIMTTEGQAATATFQCADVTRALCSVSKVCDKGNKVIFEASGGFIESPEGVRTHFRRENNVYILDMFALEPACQEQSDFARLSSK